MRMPFVVPTRVYSSTVTSWSSVVLVFLYRYRLTIKIHTTKSLFQSSFPLHSPGGATNKLRVNAIMNSVGMRAPALANQNGILTLFYCSFSQLSGWVRGNDDMFNAPIGGE